LFVNRATLATFVAALPSRLGSVTFAKQHQSIQESTRYSSRHFSTNILVLCNVGVAAARLSWRRHWWRPPPGNDCVPVRDCASLVYSFATDLLRCNRRNKIGLQLFRKFAFLRTYPYRHRKKRLGVYRQLTVLLF